MSQITVKELKKVLKDLDDELIIRLYAINAPPWITQYGMAFDKVEESDENE
jgi:hypothetical protein|tara:strand:+ start:3373 stop:3525 length:153 start_codon:yes stop_codon:yes gene_type:complete